MVEVRMVEGYQIQFLPPLIRFFDLFSFYLGDKFWLDVSCYL